jgi:lysophospholipase L1-like esterase
MARTPTSTLREASKRAVASLLGILLGLALAEGLVRGFAQLGTTAGRRIAARDPQMFLYEPFGDFGYRQRPGRFEKYQNGTQANFNAMGYRGPLVSVEKPRGTYRIVLLGGSTTFGFGVDDHDTIDAHMRTLLNRRLPGACFEVVNLALGGYDSYQVYERMRVDGTRLAPHLVIINSGINDVRNALYPRLTFPPDPRTLIWEPVMQTMRDEAARGPRFSTRVQHYSYLARIPGYAMEVLGQREGLRAIQTTEPDDSAVDYFETNIVRTTELAFAVGAAVILSTPPSALSVRNKPSDPPEKSYWIRDAGTTEAYRRRLAARLRAIAERQRASGRPTRYVTHDLPGDHFLDDAHLTGAGNRKMADGFVEAAWTFILTAIPEATMNQAACAGL